MKRNSLSVFFTCLCSLVAFANANMVKFDDTTACDFKMDEKSRIYVKYNSKIDRFTINGARDKSYRLDAKDSLISMFLLPNNQVLIVTKQSKCLLVLDENLNLVDSVDTKKIAGFLPKQIVSALHDEFAVLDIESNKLSVFSYDLNWKVDINYDLKSLGSNWIYINGIGGGYRYFYSSSQGGIVKTDNNGRMYGFLPVGNGLKEFYTQVRDRIEKVYMYNNGTFIDASFENIMDATVIKSIPSDTEITAILLNEVALKFYKDKFVIINIASNSN